MLRNTLLSMTLFVGIMPMLALADAPVITSFGSSAASQPSGYATVFSWTVPGGNGQNIYFQCPTGVTVKNSDTNVAVPCNTSQPVGGPYEYGQAAFTFVNVSGSVKSVRVKLTPRDASGVESAAGAKELYVSVSAIPQPITDFTATNTSLNEGESTTLSWIGVPDVTGVNLIFDCTTGLKFYSSGSVLPCGTPAFAAAQPTSGSVAITVLNTGSSAEFIVRVLPLVEAGVYDSTHSLFKKINVAAKVAAPLPALTSFTSSKTAVSPNDTLTLSWGSANTTGVNFIFPCLEGVSIYLMDGGTTTPKCGTLATATAFAASGTTTIQVATALTFPPNIPIALLAQNADGTYDGIRTKTVTLSFAATVPGTSAPAPVTPPTTTPKPSTPIPVVRTFQFTTYLQKGSRGTQVSALQSYLAVEPELYPEGLVTGYFGAATEAAVKRFQVRYGITTVGGSGYGVVGPKTRAKLNTLDVF